MKRKLLITGAAGTIGSVVFKGLQQDNRYDVVGADIQADEKLGIVQMDIGDEARLAELTQGIDTVNSFCLDQGRRGFSRQGPGGECERCLQIIRGGGTKRRASYDICQLQSRNRILQD